MADWIGEALGAVRRGETLAMVTVSAARGSTPREAGARMLVWPDRFLGTIGGGALERQALDQARRLLGQGERDHALQDYPLGPLLGQCCGGHVKLLVERLDGDSAPWLEQASTASEPFWLGARLGERIERSISSEEPAAEPGVLAERIAPGRPTLMLIGAGHVGLAAARLIQTLPFQLVWLASRVDIEIEGADPEVISEDELIVRVATAPEGALVAVITHSHDLDYRLVRVGLQHPGLGYLGLIGSATKRARFVRRLGDEGIDVAGLTCPIGLAGLKGKEPAVIAVSLAAQLLQLTGSQGA
jgi:xanthine dehydrogenase accessory factor